MGRGLTPENLRQAWPQGKATQGAPGAEGMTVEDFPALAREHWGSIRQAVRDETYQPAPVRRTESPQRQGKGRRWFGSPPVGDRGIQQASAQGLGPLFDPECSASSFGFRPGRSAHHAVKQIQGSIKAGYRVAVELDLAKCFDRVNHDALMARGAGKVRDQARLGWIGQSRRAGGLVGERLQPTEAGGPQGSPLSPRLSNLRLDDLDTERERRGHPFARYGEDCLLVVHRQRAGARLTARLTRFLRQPLKREINETKRTGGPTTACTFRGFACHGPRI